jgi:hypothetical protein
MSISFLRVFQEKLEVPDYTDFKKRLHRFFTYFQRVSNLCNRGYNLFNQESVDHFL